MLNKSKIGHSSQALITKLKHYVHENVKNMKLERT